MTADKQQRPYIIWFVSVIAALFGLMTIKSGGAVLFVEGEARNAAGNYVPFVLWFNFLAGFVYITAAIGIVLQQKWAAHLAILLAASTLIVFALFGIQIFNGNEYETRTVAAMTLRSSIWTAIATYTWFRFLRK